MPAPLPVDRSLSQARRAAKAGDVVVAARLYADLLDRFPRNRRARDGLAGIGVEPLVAQARETQGMGRLNDAEQLWALAASLADAPATHVGLVTCRLEMGWPARALEASEAALARHPGHPGLLDAAGRALRDLNRFDEAEGHHRAALGHGVQDAGPMNHLGILARARGDRDEAARWYRAALALQPDSAELHFNLAQLTTYAPDDPQLPVLLKQAALQPDSAHLRFATFKALDDIDRREEAFAQLVTANRLRKQALRYDVGRDARTFAWVKSLCAAPLPRAQTPPMPARPIFIVGLPRSGTTLVERILAAAPGVRPGGELSVLSTALSPLLHRLGEDGSRPAPGDIAALRARLVEAYAPHAEGEEAFTDKMPLNFRWIGFIRAALPEARIIDMRRDARAVAWSLFSHCFSSGGNGFAYDIGDIAAYMLLHRDLMETWQNGCGDMLHRVDYAALVADPEAQSRAMVRAAGLEWSDACLTPHRSAAPVLTASSAQVRRPIYGDSDRGWRRYEAQLRPMFDAMAAAGVLEGHGPA